MLVKGYKPPVINLEDMLRTQRAAWRLGLTENNEQRVGRLDGITAAMSVNLGKLWEMVRDRQALCAAVHGVTKSRTQLGD